MKTRTPAKAIKCGLGAAFVTLALSLPARADAPMQLATGQFVTPTAVRGATQQFLNPHLPAYPNFIAGEAVKLG